MKNLNTEQAKNDNLPKNRRRFTALLHITGENNERASLSVSLKYAHQLNYFVAVSRQQLLTDFCFALCVLDFWVCLTACYEAHSFCAEWGWNQSQTFRLVLMRTSPSILRISKSIFFFFILVFLFYNIVTFYHIYKVNMKYASVRKMNVVLIIDTNNLQKLLD